MTTKEDIRKIVKQIGGQSPAAEESEFAPLFEPLPMMTFLEPVIAEEVSVVEQATDNGKRRRKRKLKRSRPSPAKNPQETVEEAVASASDSPLDEPVTVAVRRPRVVDPRVELQRSQSLYALMYSSVRMLIQFSYGTRKYQQLTEQLLVSAREVSPEKHVVETVAAVADESHDDSETTAYAEQYLNAKYGHVNDPDTQEEEEEKGGVRLTLRAKDGKVFQFRIAPGEPFQKLVDLYCRKRGIAPGTVGLSFDGERLPLTSTLQQHDLEEDDMLDVIPL